MSIKRRAIVWFRQDLRLHDNEALSDALHHAYEVLPVYVFDERWFFGTTNFGFKKTGSFRARFILESVQDLQKSLKRLGSDLIIRIGKPEEELFKIAQQVRSSWVFCNRERTPEEVFVQDQLEQKLWSIGQELRFSRGKMLYHTGDLPFPIQHTPDTFTQFRKEVERYVKIRAPLPAPSKQFNFLTVEVDPGQMPTLRELGVEDMPPSRNAFNFVGGECAGLRHLDYYLWETNKLSSYRKTKDDLMGEDASTHFSAWLAQGCLSPKQIYAEIMRYQKEYGENKSVHSLFLGLMYRDYLRFLVKKHGDIIFERGGLIQEPDPDLHEDWQLFDRWREGATDVDLVDAAMIELKNTGYISNRARLNVASCLVNELKVNWQMGAEYFESILIDYDVCSNWMNWNIMSGLGTDPKEYKVLNAEAQLQRYDPRGEYVRHWRSGREAYSVQEDA